MEMVIVVAIFTILLSIAIPNFFGWAPEKRMQSAASDIQGALNVARMGAVKENTNAAIVFNVNSESYTVTVNGRTVRKGRMPSGVDLTSVTNLSTNAATTTISFDSRGLANPSVDIRVNASGSVSPLRIHLTWNGNSKIFRN